MRLEWERFFKTGTDFAFRQGTGRTDMDLWSLGASIPFWPARTPATR